MTSYFSGYWDPEHHYANDEKQIKLTFILLAIAAIVSVALITYSIMVA
jgi:hypothetical protein